MSDLGLYIVVILQSILNFVLGFFLKKSLNDKKIKNRVPLLLQKGDKVSWEYYGFLSDGHFQRWNGPYAVVENLDGQTHYIDITLHNLKKL